MLADALEHLVRGVVDNPDDVSVRDKLEIFNEALKEASSEPKAAAVTAKKKTEKAEKTEAAAPAEDKPVVPASVTPEGAAAEAEAAETVTAEDAGKSES